ncbi:MAG: NTP transferase domain-containing protein [Desulfobacteraceae bacterium]
MLWPIFMEEEMTVNMEQNSFGVIVLAAGRGTRMNSDMPKVLHRVNGKTMLSRVLAGAVAIAGKNVVVVVGHQAAVVKDVASREFDVCFQEQKKLLGTGDAVKSGLPGLSNSVRDVLIICGDVPLIRAETLEKFFSFHKAAENDITVLSVVLDNPAGYGRLLVDKNGFLVGIREEADATAEEKQNQLVNSGVYCVKKEFLVSALEMLVPDNAQKEYYLTDIVAIANKTASRAGCFPVADAREVFGVNTVDELKQAEKIMHDMN